ncbi:hypothetical protein, partial [Oceanobacillus massiliensis]|uniref:hypothetical protein n=1 Tax=Oceanobacillus massiliensis TaxID=1465765 RepID=UPI0002891341
ERRLPQYNFYKQLTEQHRNEEIHFGSFVFRKTEDAKTPLDASASTSNASQYASSVQGNKEAIASSTLA